MSKTKRPRPSSDGDGDNLRVSRKRRLEHTESEAHLAQLYNDLADEIEEIRSKAAIELVKTISTASPEDIEKCLIRLVKGVCSGRKAARLGFSIVLTEILQIVFDLGYNSGLENFRLGNVTELIVKLTEPEGRASGQERRDYLHGRLFAFKAVLCSNVVEQTHLHGNEWLTFLDAVCVLGRKKPWIWLECGAMLYEYIPKSNEGRIPSQSLSTLVEVLRKNYLLKTPEGIAIWLAISDRRPNALPKDIWHKKDPLSSKERHELRKILLNFSSENVDDKPNGSGYRQSRPSFAWQIILSRSYGSEKTFNKVFKEVVNNGLFADSSSVERKALGLQVVGIAISTAPVHFLPQILSPTVMGVILYHRADKNRYLFAACKSLLDQVCERAKSDPGSSATLLLALLNCSAADQQTKTKTVENIIMAAESTILRETVPMILVLIARPDESEERQIENNRRHSADALLCIVRTHRQPEQLFRGTQPREWLTALISGLIRSGYFASAAEADSTPLTDSTRNMFRSRLTSCLSLLSDLPTTQSMAIFDFVVNTMKESHKELHEPLGKEAREAISSAHAARQSMVHTASAAQYAHRMLLNLSILQVYNKEPDAVDVLSDVVAGCSSHSHDGNEIEGDVSTLLVELVLSFVSKPSKLFRRLSEQVFSAFASELTEEGLQSLVEVLLQKESIKGQQELFEHRDEDDDGVEVIDGANSIVENNVSDSNGESSTGSNEIEAFNAKFASIQRSASPSSGSSTSTVRSRSISPSAMEAHDNAIIAHLRASGASTQTKNSKPNKNTNKKTAADAKANMINFKNRVLDLLAIFVKQEHANVLGLDLILPLVQMIRETGSKPTAERGFALLKSLPDTCARYKAYPSLTAPGEVERCFALIASIYAELKKGGSKMHAAACTKATCFIAKVLIHHDDAEGKLFEKLAVEHARFQSEWFRNPKSRIPRTFFTEWVGWVVGVRKGN